MNMASANIIGITVEAGLWYFWVRFCVKWELGVLVFA
jgi:hypothetical protein